MESVCQISLYGSLLCWHCLVDWRHSLFSDCSAVSGVVMGLFHSRNQPHEPSTPRKLVAFSSSPTKGKREWSLISSFYSFFETVLGENIQGKF